MDNWQNWQTNNGRVKKYPINVKSECDNCSCIGKFRCWQHASQIVQKKIIFVYMHVYVYIQSRRVNNKNKYDRYFLKWKSELKLFRSQSYYFCDFFVTLKLFLKQSLFLNLILLGSFSQHTCKSVLFISQSKTSESYH